MKKNEAKALYEYYDSLVAKLTAAKLALVDGGAKSYTIGDRSLTRFDLGTLSEELNTAVRKRSEYRAIMDGKSPRRCVGVVPRDF